MDNRDEVKAFLTSRRAKITPEQAGLTRFNRNRRVPGLRRSEVADLAGVSVEYYAQLERGNLAGVSVSVLDALARALHLDEAEQQHLADLARVAGPATRTRRKPPAHQIRPSIARVLELMTDVPAFVGNGRGDVLAANPLAQALYAPMFDDPTRPANHARFAFLSPCARDFWRDLDRIATDTVAMMRTEAGRDPYDRALTDLVGELCTRSEDFRTRWAAHDVRLHRTGIKQFHHPVVGDLDLNFETLQLTADPGLTMTLLGAPADSAANDALYSTPGNDRVGRLPLPRTRCHRILKLRCRCPSVEREPHARDGRGRRCTKTPASRAARSAWSGPRHRPAVATRHATPRPHHRRLP